jgi:hypothetical protein
MIHIDDIIERRTSVGEHISMTMLLSWLPDCAKNLVADGHPEIPEIVLASEDL